MLKFTIPAIFAILLSGCSILSLPAQLLKSGGASSAVSASPTSPVTPTTPAAPITPTIAIGAYAGGEGEETQVLAFESLLGQKLSIDNHYSSFSGGGFNKYAWDIANGRTPMWSWSPSTGPTSCVLLTDVIAGKYDAQLAAQAAAVKALSGTIWIRLFYEMTDSQSESCANPGKVGAVYIAAWQHVVGIFRAAGVTNVKWVWAPGQPAYFNNIEMAFYPGAAMVDIIGEDIYNKTQTPEPFSAAVCAVAAGLHKPAAITETGAMGSTSQIAWLNGVASGCSGLTALVWWNAVGNNGLNDYRITSPVVFQVLQGVGKLPVQGVELQ